MLSAKRTQVF